jgi:hypothetical protein
MTIHKADTAYKALAKTKLEVDVTRTAERSGVVAQGEEEGSRMQGAVGDAAAV